MGRPGFTVFLLNKMAAFQLDVRLVARSGHQFEKYIFATSGDWIFV